MFIQRQEEFTIGKIWWLFAPRMERWIKPKLGRRLVRTTTYHLPTK